MLVLAFGLFALSPAPLLPARRSPLVPRRAAACRCAQSVKGFSPAYDTTVRYAAVDWARNLRTLAQETPRGHGTNAVQFLRVTWVVGLSTALS